MERAVDLKKVVITGPESTGKSILSEELALSLDACWIPEFARTYVEALARPYNYGDVEAIARHQAEEERRQSEAVGPGILIMDTWLIITKIWFEVVYGEAPDWIGDYLSTAKIDLFLVCSPDLPWVPDPVRENGGEMRQKLFELYCREIEKYGFKYEIVEGFGEARLNNALRLLKNHQIG